MIPDHFGVHFVQHPVPTDQNLPDCRIAEVRDDPTSFGERG